MQTTSTTAVVLPEVSVQRKQILTPWLSCRLEPTMKLLPSNEFTSLWHEIRRISITIVTGDQLSWQSILIYLTLPAQV